MPGVKTESDVSASTSHIFQLKLGVSCWLGEAGRTGIWGGAWVVSVILRINFAPSVLCDDQSSLCPRSFQTRSDLPSA